jgi:hypothetical protein
MRRAAGIGAAVLATATVMLSGPVTASAAGPLQYYGGDGCRSDVNHTFQCTEYFTGGTAPYTVTGSTSNEFATITQIRYGAVGGDAYEVVARGDCYYGRTTAVYLNVRDASGQTLALTRYISCGGGPSEI